MKIHDFPRDKKSMESNERRVMTHKTENIPEPVESVDEDDKKESNKQLNEGRRSRKN